MPLVISAVLALFAFAAYSLWAPGREITDGRHDLGRNGIWIQHGWLGDDGWFARNRKVDRKANFRDPERIRELAALLRRGAVVAAFHLADEQGRVLDLMQKYADVPMSLADACCVAVARTRTAAAAAIPMTSRPLLGDRPIISPPRVDTTPAARTSTH